MKKMYAAYGSNLNLAQMKYRCPTARLIGTGVLNDYELQFKGQPNHAFATVEPKKGGSVPVGLWEIRPEDEKKLDLYEGFPRHYFKQEVAVTVSGRKMTAMVYIMDPEFDFGRPCVSYYYTVRQGYTDCGLDTDILDRAVDRSAVEYDRIHGCLSEESEHTEPIPDKIPYKGEASEWQMEM